MREKVHFAGLRYLLTMHAMLSVSPVKYLLHTFLDLVEAGMWRAASSDDDAVCGGKATTTTAKLEWSKQATRIKTEGEKQADQGCVLLSGDDVPPG